MFSLCSSSYINDSRRKSHKTPQDDTFQCLDSAVLAIKNYRIQHTEVLLEEQRWTDRQSIQPDMNIFDDNAIDWGAWYIRFRERRAAYIQIISLWKRALERLTKDLQTALAGDPQSGGPVGVPAQAKDEAVYNLLYGLLIAIGPGEEEFASAQTKMLDAYREVRLRIAAGVLSEIETTALKTAATNLRGTLQDARMFFKGMGMLMPMLITANSETTHLKEQFGALSQRLAEHVEYAENYLARIENGEDVTE